MKKTIEYILVTQDKNRSKIHNILSQFEITCYSIKKLTGCWQGELEQSLAIQIIDTGIDKINPVIVDCIAQEIKVQNDQDYVLVEKRELEYSLL